MNNIYQAEVNGWERDDTWRWIKIIVLNPKDVRRADEAMPAGWDSNPIKGMTAVYLETSEMGEDCVCGYYNENRIAEPGEVRVYSQTEQKQELNYIYLRKNGHIEIGGADDNMVRYSKLEEAFNQLKDDHDGLVDKYNDLVAKFNGHVHQYVDTGAPTPPIPVTSPILPPSQGETDTSSTADITPAKIEKVNTSAAD